MDKQVEHIVSLSADLQPGLDPIEARSLEELGCLELTEEVLLRHRLLRTRMQLVQNVALQ